MSDKIGILTKLDLFKKPVSKIQNKVELVIPRDDLGVNIDVTIVNKRQKDFDRSQILTKIKGIKIAHISPVLGKTAAIRYSPESKEDIVNQAIVSLPKIRVKKRGKIKLGKKLLKQTITVANIPGQEVKEESKRIKVSSKIKVKVRTRSEVPEERIIVGDTLLVDRIWPDVPNINIRSSSYYMNNRKIFINFINTLFEPYRQALEDESKEVSCDRGGREFSLMTHQAIVRDYMNLYTPYRGLLIYHGLGAGKTCSSIAIAEGLKTGKQVIIMTPASLRQNYISELKMCGDPLYRLNQFWEFIPTAGNSALENELTTILNLPNGFISKEGGAWLVNMKNEPNYETLSTPDKMRLNRQLDIMISEKYQFINYNGMRESHLNILTRDGIINPFDNKVIVIDEAHNFVSRIVNKLNRPKSLSYQLYQYMMSATGCKIIFLTGTPIINYPNEIGIMYNMLRGYIKTFTFYVDVQTARKINQEAVVNMFSSMVTVDYIEYDVSSKTITITRNPFGFVDVKKDQMYKGVKKNNGGNKCNPQNRGRDCSKGFICSDAGNCIPMTDEVFVGKCLSVLRNNEIQSMRNPIITLHKALPDTLDSFNARFINPKTGDIKNLELFQKRILGLTSYFRSAQEQLMPSFDIEKDLMIADIPMSDYQFGLYEKAREGERQMEKNNAKRRKAQQGSDGVYSDSTSTYRIFSRAFCNFVFPREIIRPKPQEEQDLKGAILQENIDEDDLDAVSMQERLANVDGRYDGSDEGALEDLDKDSEKSSYTNRISQALTALKIGATEYLTPRGLAVYSPKFLSMLTTITNEENIGLHLVYSQFRTLEGIGIFSLVLEANGFARFTINKNEAGIWNVTIRDEDRDKPMFALYTGTEDSEEKEIIRNIYNGTWDKIPSTLREYVEGIAENNYHGEIIKVFMITSSGAEGITLKNTRYVHIVEPYWHPVRAEQVIGRARRICSHNELPEDERNVKVFIYLMRFADNQIIPVETGGLASRDLLNKDVSKLDRKTPLTSDQALWEISNIKEDINKQILRAIKSASIDCSLHSKSTDKDPIVCMSLGVPTPNEFTTIPELSSAEVDAVVKRNKVKIKVKYETVKLDGIRYALKRFNQRLPAKNAPEGELYDYDSYLQVKKLNRGEPQLVGYLRIDPRTRKLMKSDS